MTINNKQLHVEKEFSTCKTQEEVYQKIMEFAKTLPPFDEKWRVDENLVAGCQSIMHLHTTVTGDILHFAASSDALISKGLAAILVYLYSGEKAETILKFPPTFLEKLGVTSALTPGRANGFASLYLRMKQEAVKALTKKS